MRLGFGIVSLLIVLWLIFVLRRALPVGSYKSSLWLHESTWSDVIGIIVLMIGALGLGIWLIWG